MSEQFVAAGYTVGQLNAVVKMLRRQGGQDAVEKFLRGELSVSKPTRNWREEDGVIYFSVTSDGTTGPQWIERLEGKGFRISDYTKNALRNEDFKPTNGVTTEVAVLKGVLFEDNKRITKNIRTEAANCSLETPNAEIACLIREKFTDKKIKAMGLTWIVAMHEPIKDSGGDPYLLGADCSVVGRCLLAFCDEPDIRWGRENGFAFAVSQVGTQQ